MYGYIGGLGITVGCHRYWTHKTFKANKPLQVIMMLMQTVSMQYPIFKWCRVRENYIFTFYTKRIIFQILIRSDLFSCFNQDHRVHHKYTGTRQTIIHHHLVEFYRYNFSLVKSNLNIQIPMQIPTAPHVAFGSAI